MLSKNIPLNYMEEMQVLIASLLSVKHTMLLIRFLLTRREK